MPIPSFGRGVLGLFGASAGIRGMTSWLAIRGELDGLIIVGCRLQTRQVSGGSWPSEHLYIDTYDFVLYVI